MRSPTLLAFLSLLVGCGSTAGSDYGGRGAKMKVSFSGSRATLDGEVHLAMVWTSKHLAQELGVYKTSPGDHEVDLAPPPETALEPYMDEARWALGAVYAYEDRNMNGALDLLTVDSPAPIDHVLGLSWSQVVYVDGRPPRDSFVREGYSVLANATTSIDARIEITLTESGSDAQACPAQPSFTPTYPDLPLGTRPPAAASLVGDCDADHRVRWTLCVPKSFCAQDCSSGTSVPDPKQPLPADWPCP